MNNSTNSSQPLVTVAMVTYNSEKYVRTAIESVLASSYTNFELIISDDCSTDKTWEIINGFNDDRINAFRQEKNIGEYSNRNFCIDLARGSYFLFIDGDDIILPHGLETYVRYALSHSNINMIIQKGYFNNVIFPITLAPQTIFEWEFKYTSLLTSSLSSNFFKTSIFREIGKFSENIKTGDDDLRKRIALQNNILFIPGWLTWPRETPGQASSQLSDGTGLIEVLKSYLYIKRNTNNNTIKTLVEVRIEVIENLLLRELIKAYIKNDKTKRKIIKSKSSIRINISSIRKYLSNKKNLIIYPYTPENPLFNKNDFVIYGINR